MTLHIRCRTAKKVHECFRHSKNFRGLARTKVERSRRLYEGPEQVERTTNLTRMLPDGRLGHSWFIRRRHSAMCDSPIIPSHYMKCMVHSTYCKTHNIYYPFILIILLVSIICKIYIKLCICQYIEQANFNCYKILKCEK